MLYLSEPQAEVAPEPPPASRPPPRVAKPSPAGPAAVQASDVSPLPLGEPCRLSAVLKTLPAVVQPSVAVAMQLHGALLPLARKAAAQRRQADLVRLKMAERDAALKVSFTGLAKIL